jgi:hypothetical protein
VSLTPEWSGHDIACTQCSLLLPWAGHMKVLSPAPLIGRMRAAGEALVRDHPEASPCHDRRRFVLVFE